jgi:hypothetical protein
VNARDDKTGFVCSAERANEREWGHHGQAKSEKSLPELSARTNTCL